MNEKILRNFIESIIHLPFLLVILYEYYFKKSMTEIGIFSISTEMYFIGFLFLLAFIKGKLYLHENPRLDEDGEENLITGKRARIISFFGAIFFLPFSFFFALSINVILNIFSISLGLILSMFVFYLRQYFYRK